MSLEQDVAAAREAVAALERACSPLTRYFGDTVDARRLTLDVGRVRDDLNLLLARTPAPVLRGDFASVAYGDGYDDGGIPGIRS
jgi:hypothetical protein